MFVPAASRTQSNHWNNCSQTLSLSLEDIAPRNPVRGTRPRGQEGVQAKAYSKNDPSTPQAWLPNRTEPFSISHPSMNAAMSHDFRPCVDSTVGDVVQLVRTLPCRWLESYTVTARLILILNIIICFQALPH